MIKFVWQHKYTLLFFIIICFGFSIFKLKDPTIFYDSERILQFADDIEIEIPNRNSILIGGSRAKFKILYKNWIIFYIPKAKFIKCVYKKCQN
mgnify:CR=1 FL=1